MSNKSKKQTENKKKKNNKINWRKGFTWMIIILMCAFMIVEAFAYAAF